MDFIRPVDCKAVLKSSRELAPNVYSYVFDVTEGDFQYKAGQFVNVKFADPDNPSEELQRAYSFASAPNVNEFELCVELIEGGKGSRYFDSLNVGDEIKMKAPFGLCNIKDDNTNDLVMVGTGTGIAPIKGILEDMAAKSDQRKIDLFFGVRHEENLFYIEELKELETKLNMTSNFCLSQPKTEWDGKTGRVTKFLQEYDFSHQPDVYICGSEAMIKEVRNIALDAGIDKKKIHLEIFDV